MLDHFDGDENLEDGADGEPLLGWSSSGAMGNDMAMDDREDENEHGGDINDEPHDPETDYEGDYY